MLIVDDYVRMEGALLEIWGLGCVDPTEVLQFRELCRCFRSEREIWNWTYEQLTVRKTRSSPRGWTFRRRDVVVAVEESEWEQLRSNLGGQFLGQKSGRSGSGLTISGRALNLGRARR